MYTYISLYVYTYIYIYIRSADNRASTGQSAVPKASSQHHINPQNTQYITTTPLTAASPCICKAPEDGENWRREGGGGRREQRGGGGEGGGGERHSEKGRDAYPPPSHLE